MEVFEVTLKSEHRNLGEDFILIYASYYSDQIKAMATSYAKYRAVILEEYLKGTALSYKRFFVALNEKDIANLNYLGFNCRKAEINTAYYSICKNSKRGLIVK